MSHDPNVQWTFLDGNMDGNTKGKNVTKLQNPVIMVHVCALSFKHKSLHANYNTDTNFINLTWQDVVFANMYLKGKMKTSSVLFYFTTIYKERKK